MSLLNLAKRLIVIKPFSEFLSKKTPVWLISLLDGYVYLNGKFYFYVNKLYVAPSLRQARILKSYIKNNHTRQARFEFLLSSLNEKNQLILDVGGNVGYTSIYYMRFLSSYCNSKCIIFEPIKENIECLYVNTSGMPNISIIPNGLSNKFDELKFGIPEYAYDWSRKNTGLFSYVNVSDSNKLIQSAYVLPLDHFLPIFKVSTSKLTFVKIDVEGAEPDVLLGMIKVTNKYKPIIQFEYNAKTTALETVNDVLKKYVDMEYEVYTDFPSYKLKVLRFWEFYLIPIEYITKLKKSASFDNLLNLYKFQ